MSQVHIRQMPLNSRQLTGSWFPSGYYGHFRAKARADLCNQFRQLARPNPPKKFDYRQNSEATTHMFSQHDNRFKFENDPLVRGTQPGFGRRKAKGKARGEFDPFFIGWVPKNFDRKTFIEDTKISSYANDYNDNSTSSHVLSDIQSVNSSKASEVSIYSLAFSHGQPDSEQAKKTHQETFQRYATTYTRRLQAQQNDRSVNVASCLVWNNSGNETKNNLESSASKSRINFNNDTSQKNQSKLYHSTSMQTLPRNDRLPLGKATSQENFNTKVILPFRSSSSCETTHINSVESLISKYM